MKKIVVIEKIHICNKMNFNSNINEVIRAVLYFLLLFYEEISHAQISIKKHKKAQKRTKKHQKYKNTTKQKYKTQISEQK